MSFKVNIFECGRPLNVAVTLIYNVVDKVSIIPHVYRPHESQSYVNVEDHAPILRQCGWVGSELFQAVTLNLHVIICIM